MPQTKPKPATYADIEALPPNVVGEILYDRLVIQPHRDIGYTISASSLAAAVGSPYVLGKEGPGGWLIFDRPEVHLGPHVVVPSIAGWRRERLTGDGDRTCIEDVPDWVCEVLWPATEHYDVGEKCRIYATFEVPYLWQLDPRSRVLKIFKRQGTNWSPIRTFAGTQDVSAPPFDATTFSLGLLWPFDPPAEPSKEEA